MIIIDHPLRFICHENYGKIHSLLQEGKYNDRYYRVETHTHFVNDQPFSDIKSVEQLFYFTDSENEYETFEEMIKTDATQ